MFSNVKPKIFFKVSFECANIDLKNIKKIVEFLLCIPGTNASVERVFSQMNCLWTDQKNRLNSDS